MVKIKKKVKNKKDFLKDLQLMNENMKVLFSNDQVLNGKIIQLHKTLQESQQQPQHIKLSVDSSGISIESPNPIKDIGILLKDKKIKSFVGLTKQNEIMKHITGIE